MENMEVSENRLGSQNNQPDKMKTLRNKKLANSEAFEIDASERRKDLSNAKSARKENPSLANVMDIEPAPIDRIPARSLSLDEKIIAVDRYQNIPSRDEFANEKNASESLLRHLRGIKRKRSIRAEDRGESSSRLSRDEQISIDEFDKSVRALDAACDSQRSLRMQKDPSTPLGLVPFGVLTKSSSLDDKALPEKSQSVIHLSFDEDNEEDMFAEAKDPDLEDVEEFGNWDYKTGETPQLFHGFSSSESEHSKNVAARCSQREELEKLQIYEAKEEPFSGFSSAESVRSMEHEKMWNMSLTKYDPKIAIEMRMESTKVKEPRSIEGDSIGLPRIRELKNMEFSGPGDKKFTNPAKNSTRTTRSLPSRPIERSENALSDNCKNNLSSESVFSISPDSRDSCSFSTAGGRKIAISEAAISRARKIYKDLELHEREENVKNEITKKIRNYDKDEKMRHEFIGKTGNYDEAEIKNKSSLDFTTARGGELKISKDTLSKSQAQYEKIDHEIDVNTSEPNDSMKNDSIEKLTEPNSPIGTKEMKNAITIGFTTARGGELKISKEALSKAQAQFEKIPIEPSENSIDPNPRSSGEDVKKDIGMGFTTAGGREIKISQEALSKAKTKFEEIEMDSNESNSQMIRSEKKNDISSGFRTARVGGQLKISKETFSMEKARFEEINEDSTTPRSVVEETKKLFGIGFTTARGCEIKISQKAWSRAKARFEDIENEFDDYLPETNITNDSLVAVPSSDVPAQIPLAAESCNVESLEFEDFPMDEATKKRKFDDIDDDTPLRRDPPWKRKKGRYVSDLTGRKLFVENSSNISIIGESVNDSSRHDETISTTLEPRKIHISEEINASTAALIEDEERSQEATKSQTGVFRDPESVTETEKWKNSSNLCDSVAGAASKISETIVDDGEKKSLEIQPESIPDDLTFDSQFSQELHHSQVVNKFIMETMKIMEARLAMTSKQDEAIRAKRRIKPQACDGSLYRSRTSQRDSRFSWQELTEGEAPVPRDIAGKSMDNEVLSVTANSAASYSFCCADFYGGKNVKINVEGIKIGDGAYLILDERNCAGAREFERSFLASPGVDPNLVPTGWVKNHYRWIVWKLASMDRVKFGHKCLPRMLTPNRVMLELKYRYDREIYRSQWPPLRRILEKNEDAAARLVLCVASVMIEDDNETPVKGSSSTPSALGSLPCRIKLTDGWYCIPASIDVAMINCIKSGKIKEGTKIITFGAKAMNLDQGCSILEIPEAVTLRIHTNSTRRVRWDTKLDFFHPNRGPMSLSLNSVKSNGGAICKLVVAVARLYPILYREKLPDGQFVFRNARCDEEAARAHEARCQAKMEEIFENTRSDFQLGSRTCNQEEEIRQRIASKLRECLPPPRDVTPVLKIRVAQGETSSAMMTIWSTDRENDQVFEEGSSVIIYNCFASGQRCNELQITAGRNTIFNRETSRRMAYPERIFTSLMDIGESGFNPVYGEFDTVGIVSSIGAAPHGMKNFETVNLSCPRSEDPETSDFLSILFWQGVSTHGYSKILTVGTFVACSNLEWRRNTSRSIPTAYCTERSVFTKNPRQKHLAEPFESLNRHIKNPFSYAANCAGAIQAEVARKTPLRTPVNGTPCRGQTTMNNPTIGWSPRDPAGSQDFDCTPKNMSRKASIMRRIRKLEVYGEPPKLPTIVINHGSPKVLSDFRSPVVTPVTKS